MQPLTGDNYSCENRFIPQQEVSLISRWQLLNHPIRRTWLPFRLSFSVPSRIRRVRLYTYLRAGKSAKETSQRCQVFPLRFSTLHHSSELIEGMRKGVRACVRACTRRKRRDDGLFSTLASRHKQGWDRCQPLSRILRRRRIAPVVLGAACFF